MRYVIHIVSDCGSCSFPIGYYSGKYQFQHEQYANGENNYSHESVKKYRSEWQAEKVLDHLERQCVNVNHGEVIAIA